MRARTNLTIFEIVCNFETTRRAATYGSLKQKTAKQINRNFTTIFWSRILKIARLQKKIFRRSEPYDDIDTNDTITKWDMFKAGNVIKILIISSTYQVF